MQMEKSDMMEFATMVASAVVDALEGKKVINTGGSYQPDVKHEKEMTAYQKTEKLLFKYMDFVRIVEERKAEIESLRKYGVPQKSLSIVEYSPGGGVPKGLCLEEEAVEAAVRSVEDSVHDIVQAIELIDKCMQSLSNDPYYDILEMRYFEGRTQEDIADYYNCSQVTISKNKSRLVKELALKLFPNQVIKEMMM